MPGSSQATFKFLQPTLINSPKILPQIILPRKGSGTYQQQASTCTTNGYRSRRLAVDSGISLITDLKCAKLFVSVSHKFFK